MTAREAVIASSEREGADIAVVGAGAAGLAAAIFAAERARQLGRAAHVVLLEGARRPGAKILVSGGGRCNVTHDTVRAEDFHAPRAVVRSVLRAFDERAAMRWFEELGVALKREETGKIFPVADDARAVLRALLIRAADLGTELRAGHRVRAVEATGDVGPARFRVVHEHGVLRAGRVVLATGGRSLPKSGSDGHGWRMAHALGHSCTAVHPALVPLVLEPSFFHASLSGVSHAAELEIFSGGRLVDRRGGSLLWTHFGVSGPVVMDASRFWVMAQDAGGAPELRANFLPGKRFEDVERELVEASRPGGGSDPSRGVGTILAGWLPQRVGDALLARVEVPRDRRARELARDERRRIVHALTGLVLPVVRARGWNHAEVTAGGVPLDEIDHRAMESKRVPGLYLVGEMLDCDGRIGGFNFQWAWSTGYVAGRAAVESLVAPAAPP